MCRAYLWAWEFERDQESHKLQAAEAQLQKLTKSDIMPQHQITLTSYTGRLKLVPPSAADDEPNSILRSHPVTRRYLRFFPENTSVDEIRKRRERQEEDGGAIYFHVHLQNSDSTTTFAGSVGMLGIDALNDSCKAGILLLPEFHRGGIATDALYTLLNFIFFEKKMHRVTFITGADNVMMRGWLENVLGAQEEFRTRECWKDGIGKYSDALGYAIFEKDWTGSMKSKVEQRLDKTKAIST